MSASAYIATDRRNAFSWISRGLVLPPALMDKHRDDAMSSTPGTLLLGDERAAAGLAAAAGLPVVVEVDLGGLVLQTDVPHGRPTPVRGALSARRIVRLHLPEVGEREEVAARAYRGFDGATLPLAVTPELFGAGQPSLSPPEDAKAVSGLDDRELRRREALVASVTTLLSEQLAEQLVHVLLGGSGDGWTALVEELRRRGTVTSREDAGLLRQVGEVLMGLPRGTQPTADEVVEALRDRLPQELLQQVEAHLDWIVQLSRGEAALQPFKDRGGMRSVKALLLFLLRPSPEDVRGWDVEEQNAGREVVDLAAIMAGLVSGYGGLPAELRASPLLDALLDWAAAGLQPTDVEPEPRPPLAGVPAEGRVEGFQPGAAHEGGVATEGDGQAAPADPRTRLERAVADGDHEEPLSLAQQLGWSDTQRIAILAPDFQVTVRGRDVEVVFPPGAAPQLRLVESRFLERLGDLSDVALEEALRMKDRAAARRATAHGRGARAGGTRQKKAGRAGAIAEQPVSPGAAAAGGLGGRSARADGIAQQAPVPGTGEARPGSSSPVAEQQARD